MPRVYLLDIKMVPRSCWKLSWNDFCSKILPDGKNYNEFCKDGNSDISTMDLDLKSC